MKHPKQTVKRSHYDLPYRRGVGMMVLNKTNEVFVARRIDASRSAWQMPQGGIDPGESPEMAALRELEEEIGTNNVRIIASTKGWHTYEVPRRLVGLLWNGNYRGQSQKWFAMRFLGEDVDINIHTDHPEFCEWRWVSIEELPKLTIYFKRETYRQLIDELLPEILKDSEEVSP